ncbi:uncharacterized protein LOC115681790 [Syzygium oleosum]|uniref:uncharacterized protein LOC115681790 n=1 Tax=Syzygium oleosum TaxID=219896 RepID=UPI0024B97C93|nr:uncharacterized protein LOC115681790 [Syzygium oleosum]
MIKQLPDSIGKLKSLCTLDLSSSGFDLNSNRWGLLKDFGKLEKLEELYLGHRKELVGEIPDEIGYLSSLRVLDLCWTRISGVPGTIHMLSHLSTLDLTCCDEITELPELPASLVHLRVKSCSLQVVPNLSKLTNLVELVLSDGSYYRNSSNLKHTCDLGWIGRLSKLKKLDLCLPHIAAPPTDLGSLSLLEDLALSGLHLQPLEQPRPSLLSSELDNFSSAGSPLSNLKNLSNLTLGFSRLQEIQLNGLLQLQSLHLDKCDLQSLSIPCSLRTLRVRYCPNMIEIKLLSMSSSLEELYIFHCGSIERIVLCGEVGSLGVLDQSESSSRESTYCAPGVLLPNALKKLKKLHVEHCEKLLEIQVIGTLLSLQDFSIERCNAMEKLSGMSNLKNLHRLAIRECYKLRVVKGLEELEFLTRLDVEQCPSLETLLDVSNSKIPDECLIRVIRSRESLDSSSAYHITFKRHKRIAQQGAPPSETNKVSLNRDFIVTPKSFT